MIVMLLKFLDCRPLPEELVKYAREDTHYLLYIHDRMRGELMKRGNEHSNLLRSAIQRSTEICAKVCVTAQKYIPGICCVMSAQKYVSMFVSSYRRNTFVPAKV